MHKLSILSHFPLGGGLSHLRGADCFSAETNLASWDDFGQRRRQKAASIAGTTQDHVQGGRAPASVNRNSVRVLSVVPAQQRPPRSVPIQSNPASVGTFRCAGTARRPLLRSPQKRLSLLCECFRPLGLSYLPLA